MPTVKPAKKPGRNAPCWCGSGRKYKDCHRPIEEARLTAWRTLLRTQDSLAARLIEATDRLTDTFATALALFWNERYGLTQMQDLDDLEDRGAERFLTWLAFDYPLADGRTLVETLRDEAESGTFEATPDERHLLHLWASTRLNAYVVEEVRKGTGPLVRGLLDDQPHPVDDKASAQRVEPGEVIIGHLLPVALPPDLTSTEVLPPGAPTRELDEPTFFVAGAMAQLTSDTADKLREFAALHVADIQRSQPDATLADLPRLRSAVLNHFVMEMPQEYTPGVLDDILLRTRAALHFTGLKRIDLPDDEPPSGDKT